MLADFVPALPVLAAYAAASVMLGLTPGPDMALFPSKTVSQSRAAGLAAFGGASTGLIIHSVLVAAGLSVLLAASATAFLRRSPRVTASSITSSPGSAAGSRCGWSLPNRADYAASPRGGGGRKPERRPASSQ